ncbi:MAG: GNAT family N-acetyltransferase [Agathobacter sp.]|nr:GNAT family N-acetyltransferase [Agathobacter sp.]
MIREMTGNDWKRVAEIYSQGIEKGISTFNTKCPSFEEWDSGHVKSCRFVYVEGKKVVGWVALSPISSRCVYKGCVEMSIYIDNDYQGRGIGKKLIEKLLCEAKKQGYWSIYSAVISINEASVALHKKCGFREIGYRERIAKDRFGNWQNTTLFELRLESKVENSTNNFKNSHRFFENKECKYFPCHKGIKDFNCLFCYCPLYGEEKCIGNPKYINEDGKRRKDCSECAFPHRPENYDKIVEWLSKRE